MRGGRRSGRPESCSRGLVVEDKGQLGRVVGERGEGARGPVGRVREEVEVRWGGL